MQFGRFQHEGLIRIEDDEVSRRTLGEPALRQSDDLGRSVDMAAKQRAEPISPP